jgi:hypothetical protein
LLNPVVAFKVYDVDRDGYISNGELFLVLKMMVGNNLKVHFDIVFPEKHQVISDLIGPTTAANSG